MPEKYLLGKGTVLLLDPIQTSDAVSIGLWLNTGSRDEGEREHGFSHFTEHMLFKGTEKRSHYDIALDIDGAGGEINGATGKENTNYFINSSSEYALRALDILTDMYFNSTFDKGEFDKERAVILDEIDMSFDDPDDYVGELYSGVLWGRIPFGLPVIGEREDIEKVTVRNLKKFYKRHYLEERLIVSAAGKIDPAEIRREVERLLKRQAEKDGSNGPGTRGVQSRASTSTPSTTISLSSIRPPEAAPRSSRALPSKAALTSATTPSSASCRRRKPKALKGRRVVSRDIEQVYFICGREGYGYRDENRYPMALFNTILGNSFSSRLFQRVREKLGLCYSIASSATSYSDVGEFSVSFSTSGRNLPRVLDAVDRELALAKNGDMTRDELEMSKRRFRGNYVLAKENNEWKMVKMAMQEMLYGRLIPYDETLMKIDKVTLDDLNRVGEEILSSSAFSIASVGPREQHRYLEGFQFTF
jgi:predicted Zn-dependent peptidase